MTPKEVEYTGLINGPGFPCIKMSREDSIYFAFHQVQTDWPKAGKAWDILLSMLCLANGCFGPSHISFYVKGAIRANQPTHSFLVGCLNQWLGRFLGITGWNLSVCKSNRLYVDILRFSFIKFGLFYKILSSDWYVFCNLELQPVISQTQPVHL